MSKKKNSSLINQWKEQILEGEGIMNYLVLLLTLGVVYWVVMAFTGLYPWQPNGYNSYALQANAWLDGHLDLGQDYPHLELAIFHNKYFVSFPPFPSYVLLPFALFFEANTPDHFIGLVFVLLGAVYGMKLYYEFRRTYKHSVFWVLFLILGNGLLQVSVNGYVWFIAQNMCFALSLMGIYYIKKKKAGLGFAFWACAVGCRPMVAFYFPVLFLLLTEEWKKTFPKDTVLDLIKKKWYWMIPTAVIGGSYMILNQLRFGSPVEFGHNYLPEFTRTKTGQFNFAYLKENIGHLFRFAGENEETGWVDFYNADGMNIFLVIPMLLLGIAVWGMYLKTKGLQANWKLVLPGVCVLHILFICCHKTLGGWHFGNRYVTDTIPYVYMGMLVCMPKKEWFHKLAIPFGVLGMAINIIGTVLMYRGVL